ncbi:MAG: isoprenylcysteine carboxylmethyltransferase family protein [Verrucomicrobiota bacterium]|nr:isoprenylcysteine carboxylmethyltransferase family protein [Verrucomicrobiota bacterium]
MKLPIAALLGFAYLISELLLNVTRRSRGTGQREDRSTLRILWLVILASVAAGIYVARRWPGAAFPHQPLFIFTGIILFALGIALRWWAIVTLGRFFTVDVQIAQDHQLVERGPFRLVRHPSYTGVLLAFLGFALTVGNWAAALVIMAPILAAFVRRMNVEEQALTRALGETYTRYLRRTHRLIPGIY